MKEGSRIECLSKYQGFNMVGSREQEGNKDGEIENWFQEDGVCIKKEIHRLQKRGGYQGNPIGRWIPLRVGSKEGD